MSADRKSPPLVIFGLDAGDPDLIKRWVAEGRLPTIASIMERGYWAKTEGPELISEHGVWVSLFSGVSRAQHGYYYFRQLKPGTYDLETVTALDIDVPPFWTCLRGGKKKVAIIDVPDHRPLPGLRGLQLANWATHDNWDPGDFPLMAEPPELLQEVRRNFGPKLVTLEKHQSTLEEDAGIYREVLDRIKKKGALCRHLLARDRFDLTVIVFGECHLASHQFWKYYVDSLGKAENGDGQLTDAIRDVYQAIDREVGHTLKQLPSDSNVFIVSSVGMEDDYPATGLIQAFCRELNYQMPQENGSFRPVDLARKVIPESWRIALSRHFSRDKRERLLADQFRHGTNWRKTTAFTIPAAYTSFVRVNLRGREPEGIVGPGTEYEALLRRIQTDLEQLIDPKTNEPAVTRVLKTVELFGREPHPSLPDLFVEWKPGRFMERVVHPRAELVQKKPDFYRRSDHTAQGFVAAAGPSIRSSVHVNDVSVLALAPTFLSLMSESVSQGMTGRVIEGIIRG